MNGDLRNVRYYAARTAAVEYLHTIRRQASVFIVREIFPDYWAPLGVWVIREAVRDALAGGGMRFDGVGGALSEMQTRIRTPHDRWRGEMQLLDECRFQRTLMEFL